MKRISLFYSMMAALICCSIVSCAEDEATIETPPVKRVIEVYLQSPAADAEGVSDMATFTWEGEVTPSTDLPVTYDLYMGAKSTSLELMAEGITEETFTLEESLELESKHYWKVVAKIENDTFTSAVQSFKVRSFDAPVATEPANNAEIHSELTFKWDLSNIDQSVTYDVMVGEEGVADEEYYSVGSTTDEGELAITDFAAAKIEDNKSYSWFVVATYGEQTSTSEKLNFTKIKVDYPSEPVIKAPAAGASFLATDTPVFSWDESTDPEDDPITYDVFIGGVKVNAEPITGATFNPDLTSYTEGDYEWYVVANDDKGHATTSAVSTFKIYVIIVGAGEITALPGGVLALNEPFTWGSPDGSEDSSYTYTLSYTSNGSSYTSLGTTTQREFTIKNSLLSCDLSNYKSKNFKFKVVATKGGESKTYDELSFTPEMQGTFTDKRGDAETKTYAWVRVGTQIWMAENLATEYCNDGTPMEYYADNVKISAVESSAKCSYSFVPDTFYNSANASACPLVSKDTYPVSELKKNLNGGYVYSKYTAKSGKLAPKGWRVITSNDATTFLSYLGFVKYNNTYLSHESYHNAAMHMFIDSYEHANTDNLYGLNFAVGPIRQDDGWRGSLWDNKIHLTVIDATGGNNYRLVFGLKEGEPSNAGSLPSNSSDYVQAKAGNPYMELRNWGNAVFYVRCILEE